MSNPIAPGSSADVNVQVRALGTDPNVSAQYKTVILKKNIVDGVNTLTQAMLTQSNVKYVIKYDYIITEDINIPENCILYFDGGSIAGNFNINNCLIDGFFAKCSCTFVNVTFVRNTINYAEFGAKLDGITNDYNAIKACHDFANKYGLDVKQTSGKIVIHNENRIEIKTNTDLSGCSYEVNENRIIVPEWREYGYGDAEGYIIKEDDDNQFVDISEIGRSNPEGFTVGSTFIYPVQNYKESFFVIKSNRIFGTRIGGGYDITNCECFTTNRSGYTIDGPLYFDYNDDNTKNSITLKVKSIRTKKISVKLPKVILNLPLDEQPKDNVLFIVERNNVDLHLMPTIITESYPTGDFVVTQNSFIELRNCYGCHIKGGICDNKGTVYGEDASVTHYVIFANCCSDINLENCNMYNGWGVVNFTYCKTLTVNHCVLNRIDSHCGISNVTITDTTIYGNNNGINFGYGIGTIFVQNIRWHHCVTSNESQNILLYNRGDYEYFYRGKVYVDNVMINRFQYGGNITLYCLNQNSSAQFKGYLPNHGSREVYIKNIYIGNDVFSGKHLSCEILSLGNARTDFTLEFDKIVLENINLNRVNLNTKSILNTSGAGALKIKQLIIKDCDFSNATINNTKGYILYNAIIENSNLYNVYNLFYLFESNSPVSINNSTIMLERLYKNVFPRIVNSFVYPNSENELYLGGYSIILSKIIPYINQIINIWMIDNKKHICKDVYFEDGVTFNNTVPLDENTYLTNNA